MAALPALACVGGVAPTGGYDQGMTVTKDAKPKGGLEDVVAASSAICYLDGQRGVLAYYGYDIHDLARAVHKEIAERLRYARIWGSARFDGQQVDRDHALVDRDVVELHA